MGWLDLAPPVLVGAAFVLALVVALVGRKVRVLAPLLALLAPAAVLVVGIVSLAKQPAGAVAETSGRVAPWLGHIVSSGTLPWFSAEGMQLNVGWTVDSLSALMLVVVGVVASMVVIFSAGYMAGDKGWARYFALLALFTGSMTLLVIASDLVGLFIGWELVGVCSFLLIGFWFEKPSAMRAATKAFITTRVGDAGMLLGLAVLWRATGALSYEQVFAGIGALSMAALTTAALLLFLGAAGKSAQFPLHIWLPDAMEGPTPVSALIHAATMVAAGVFLIARLWPLFEASDGARAVILGIGVVTAFGAATIAVAQRDIKKVLAYSTISQLGYMMSAMGAGAFVVGMFHLVTHAAFKALLFLAAGSVIHGAGTQDLREMGGLRRAMPWTAATWIVGAAALAGIPPFSGFFSKDEVVSAVWHANTFAGLTLIAASALTAFYVARATRLAFFGERAAPAGGQVGAAQSSADHAGGAHESPWNMRGPLVVLAALAAGLGFAEPQFARILEHEGGGPEVLILATSVVVALAGVALGWFAERRGAQSDESLESRLGVTWKGAARGWGFDGFVVRFVVEPSKSAAKIAYGFFDRLVIDGAAEGAGGLARWVGRGLAALQTGDGQWYATLIGVGVLLLLVATVWMGRMGL